jgi:hypothetical protein
MTCESVSDERSSSGRSRSRSFLFGSFLCFPSAAYADFEI